jgi:DUF4097 and DUF4098 domain-containing protein YvlB
MRKLVYLLAVSLSLCAMTLAGMSVKAAKEQDEFRQTYNLAAGGAIALSNINGAIHVQVWDEPRVEVYALKTGSSKERLDAVKIEVNAQANLIDIKTIYPRGNHNDNVAVEYWLKVPRNANLSNITSVNGSIEVADMEGRVNAETVNGSITIAGSSSAIAANTVNGSIKATLYNLSTSEPSKFQTVNGSLTLFLPDNLNADVEAETTNGHINADYPVNVTGSLVGKHMKGRIGAGGARLNLETVNGSINLNRAKL